MKTSLYPPLSINELGQRDNQEDNVIQWDNRLFVLCDGMGGHEHGEVASQTICQSLTRWFEENIKADASFTDDQLRCALEYAYKELDKHDNGSLRKMGTTLTLLYLHAQGITAAHIGDSRIYHIRPGIGLLYQSRDHSLVFDLYQAGEITFDEMATFPQKNFVTRAMTPGEDNRMRPDIIHITDIQAGDYFYMCSDGMLEQMSNDELVALFSSNVSDEEKRNQLIVATSNNQDNHSAWLIHVKDVTKEEGDEVLVNEEPTSHCNVLNIVPQPNPSDDVKLADDDDVVVVSTPKLPKKRIPFLKIAVASLLLILALLVAWFLFWPDNNQEEQIQQERMILTPNRHNYVNNNIGNSMVKDTNNIEKHESGNQ